ncbi:MAG: hypothetical protein V1882_02145, partial [Candidatus Omnitrophota bacterium]
MSFDAEHYKPSPELLKKIPAQMAWHFRILPLKSDGTGMEVACPVGMSRDKKEELRIALGCPISFIEIDPLTIDLLLPEVYGLGADVLAKMQQT